MISALDHVIILVDDIAAATRSYTALLGREPSWAGPHPEYGTTNALFRLENTYIELLAAQGEGVFSGQVRAVLKERGEGPYGLVFATDDAEAAYRRLDQCGLQPQAPAESSGVDAASGAERRWRNVFLPQARTGGLMCFVIQHLSAAGELAAREPAEAEAAASALDHVVIQARDAEAAQNLLGASGLDLRLALDKTAPEWGGRMLFYRVGGATVEVIAKLPPQPPEPDEAMLSFWGIAYKVADIDAAHRRLKREGVAVSEVRKGRKPGTRVATVKSHTHGAPTLLIGPE